MTIYISNKSVDVYLNGYATTSDGLVVWLDMTPQHVKTVGAIRAEMTSNTRKYMRIFDDESPGIDATPKTVYGLGRGYINMTADASLLSIGFRARSQHLRMVAPEATTRIDNVQDTFYALTWTMPNGNVITPAMALAVVLEREAAFPVKIGWGAYILHQAIEQHGAETLISGGQAPKGFAFRADTPWLGMIADGLAQGHLTMDGKNCCHQNIPTGDYVAV